MPCVRIMVVTEKYGEGYFLSLKKNRELGLYKEGVYMKGTA